MDVLRRNSRARFQRIASGVASASLLAACGSSGDDATVAAPEAPDVSAAVGAQTTAEPRTASAPPVQGATAAPRVSDVAPTKAAAARKKTAGTPQAPTSAVEATSPPASATKSGRGPAAKPPAGVPRPDAIKLGGVFPLSGPLGGVGTAMMQGVQSVLTEVNAAGGVGGTKLELVIADDQFDPVRGKALIQQQIEQGVFAFAGIFSPFTTQAALPAIRAAKIPVVSPSGSDDREFDEPMLFPVTNPCGRQMAGNVAHLVRERNVKKLAVVYLNVEAVANCAGQFTDLAEKLGAEIVFNGATAPAAPDCAGRVIAARASGAEGLIVITDNLGTVKCLQARAQQNWDVPVSISYNNTDDPTILRALGDRAEGLLSSSPFAGASSPQFAQQCGAIERYYPDSKVQFFSIVGCLGTKLLVAALQEAGADRDALLKVLESGRTFDFGGLVPTLSYGPGRHLPYDLTATVEVRDGRWVRTGKLYAPPGTTPDPPRSDSGTAATAAASIRAGRRVGGSK